MVRSIAYPRFVLFILFVTFAPLFLLSKNISGDLGLIVILTLGVIGLCSALFAIVRPNKGQHH
jgi:hypothetical protein